MAVRKPGINWYYNSLHPTLGRFVVAANVAVAEYAKNLAEDIKRYAQDNAPWDDRTGDARAGLDTQVDHHGFRVDIYLFHTVDYGIWLEIRWGGIYAIIIPTLEHFEGETWQHFDGMIGAATLGRGSPL